MYLPKKPFFTIKRLEGTAPVEADEVARQVIKWLQSKEGTKILDKAIINCYTPSGQQIK